MEVVVGAMVVVSIIGGVLHMKHPPNHHYPESRLVYFHAGGFMGPVKIIQVLKQKKENKEKEMRKLDESYNRACLEKEKNKKRVKELKNEKKNNKKLVRARKRKEKINRENAKLQSKISALQEEVAIGKHSVEKHYSASSGSDFFDSSDSSDSSYSELRRTASSSSE